MKEIIIVAIVLLFAAFFLYVIGSIYSKSFSLKSLENSPLKIMGITMMGEVIFAFGTACLIILILEMM